MRWVVESDLGLERLDRLQHDLLSDDVHQQEAQHPCLGGLRHVGVVGEQRDLVAELANKLVERADKGEAMAALAKEAGDVKVETTPPFTRTTEPQGLTKDAIARAFTLAKGKAGAALTLDNKTRTVFKVTEITPAPAPTKEQRERISKDLQSELTDEVLNEYVVALQKRLGTHINEAEFKKATGATETQ